MCVRYVCLCVGGCDVYALLFMLWNMVLFSEDGRRVQCRLLLHDWPCIAVSEKVLNQHVFVSVIVVI